MSIVAPSGCGGSEEARSLVNGWKQIRGGKTETRQERLLRERKENVGKPSNPDVVSRDAKRQAMIEAQQYAENQIENPMAHLKEAYQNRKQVDKNKKKAKLDAQKTLALLTEVTERGGKIIGVQEAGFGIFLVEYVI